MTEKIYQQEAEQILREHWTDAHIVGGFGTELERHTVIEQLIADFGGIGDLELIGYCSWSDYEEGFTSYLFTRSGALLRFDVGVSVYGSYGNSLTELASTTIEEWLEHVSVCQS